MENLKKKSSYCTKWGHSRDFSEPSWVALEACPQSRLLCWRKHIRRRGPGKGRGEGGGGRGRGGVDSHGFSPPSSDTACLKDAGVSRSERWLQRERQWKIKQKTKAQDNCLKKKDCNLRKWWKWIGKKKKWKQLTICHVNEGTATHNEHQTSCL